MADMAWFMEYLTAHQPDGKWNAEAAWAVRVCCDLYRAREDAALKQHVIAWADSLIAADECVPACGKALFFALEETRDDRYREAIERVMAQLGREPGQAVLTAAEACQQLPFRMTYETKLGGMEKVGLAAGKFRQTHRAHWNAASGLLGGSLRDTAAYLVALTDAIDACSDQLYEHWRALVDLYREALKGALAAEDSPAGETGMMLVYATVAGVAMGLIDPERYLPIARRRVAALKAAGVAQADAILDMKGGAC